MLLTTLQSEVLASAIQFAELVGINRQNAAKALQKCCAGKLWRGALLQVYVDSSKGGKSGLNYRVQLSSIPPEHIVNTQLLEQIKAEHSKALSVAEVAPVAGRGDMANWKTDLVIEVIQNSEPNTPERRQLIETVAQSARYPTGAKRGKSPGRQTLYRWVKEYEHKGLRGMRRKGRCDVKSRRVVVSKKIDPLIAHLSIEDQNKLANEIKRRIASLWRSGSPTWPTVQMNSIPKVMKLVMNAGCQLSQDEIRPLCLLPRKLVESQKYYKAVALYRNDAGRSAAIQIPRIKRTRDNLQPMQWVAGDVHHVDVLIRREDGSLCTPKAVAWQDLANNRVYIDLFLMPKGKMIRREHVIESFVNMCANANWGVPTELYLDRGGEYNWGEFCEDLFTLKNRVEVLDKSSLPDGGGIQRSRAYNPQSKIIETVFAALEKSVLAQLPGHIGGDRFRKKTQNQGKDPIPYNGDFTAFKQSFNLALDYYHCKPQQGHLKGLSPNDRFKQLIEAGWKSTLLDPDELAVVFAKEKSRMVNAGGLIKWGNKEYRHDELLALVGTKVFVRQPLFGDQSRLFIFDEYENPLCVADPVTYYPMGDIKGAGEQQRQASLLNKAIREMESNTDKLDLESVMEDVIDAFGSSPQAETSGVITIGHSKAAKLAREQEKIEVDDYEQQQLKEYARLNSYQPNVKRA